MYVYALSFKLDKIWWYQHNLYLARDRHFLLDDAVTLMNNGYQVSIHVPGHVQIGDF